MGKVKFCEALFLEPELRDAVMRYDVRTEYEKAFSHEPSRSDRVGRILLEFFRLKGERAAPKK